MAGAMSLQWNRSTTVNSIAVAPENAKTLLRLYGSGSAGDGLLINEA